MTVPESASFSPSEVREWLITYVAQLIEIERQEVDPAKSFEIYGLDSSAAVGMSGDLGSLLEFEFETSLAYDYPTINALVDHLVSSKIVSPG